MRKNFYLSYVKILCLVVTSIFEIFFLIALIIGFINNMPVKDKISFGIVIASLIVFQYILIELLILIFSKIGRGKVYFSNNYIKTRRYEFDIDESIRLVYSPFNLNNFLTACPGELIAIKDHKEIKLGWYTKREIQKIKKYIPTIIDEVKSSRE